MHCGICGANESIENRIVDAEDSTTGMEFNMRVVFCAVCGSFGVGITHRVAMLDFGMPQVQSVAPGWELPREWVRPKDGLYSESARRVLGGLD